MRQQRVSLHTECSLAFIMANPKIKVKRSSVEGKVPAVTQLERGELAVNSYDGKVYILKDQFSVGIATTTHTINPWNEPNGVGAGVSYSGDVLVTGIATFFKSVRAHNGIIIGDDNKSILLGTSDDMRIRHTGSHSEITDEGTGDLRLGSSRTVIGNPTFSETCARFVQNGPSELYHDNTLRLKTSSSGVNITDDLGVSGVSTFSGNVNISAVSTFSGGVKLDSSNADFDDDVKIRMGDSQDLLIFHQESNGNSIIREQGGGVLSLQTNGAYMNVYDSTNQQTMAQFTNGGACQFRHNGTIRLQTTSSGAEVIGTLNVTGVSTSLTHHSTGGTYRGTQDTKTDVGFVMDLDKKLYVDYNGYLRNIIGHESADNSIQIGQHNTGLIDDIVLKPGTSGQVILHHGSNSSNIKLSTLTTGVNVNGTTVTDGLTVGNYDFPTTVGSEGLVLKVASDGNLEFGSGASGGVVPTEKTFTATQGQTVFTDTSTLPTYIQVFVNGIKIRPTTDFSKSGSSVTLVTGATAGDEIDLVRFD